MLLNPAVAVAEAEERSEEQQFDDDQVVAAMLEPTLAYITAKPRPNEREHPATIKISSFYQHGHTERLLVDPYRA